MKTPEITRHLTYEESYLRDMDPRTTESKTGQHTPFQSREHGSTANANWPDLLDPDGGKRAKLC